MAELKTELLDHQRRVVDRIKKQPGLVVAHGTGSGKTLSSIGAIVDLSPTKARVVVPASLKENYRKEIKKHVKGRLPIEVESLQKAVREGNPPRGDLLVVDEAHRVRNPESKGYKLLRRAGADKRMLMTASPVYNKPEDVAPLVNLAAGRRELPTGTEFERRYVKKPGKGILTILNPFAQKDPKIVNEGELGRVLNKWVDYHGGNDEGFPALEEKRIDVPMTERQTQLHNQAWGKVPVMTRMRLSKGLPPDKKDLSHINQFQAQTRQLSSSERKYSTSTPELSPKLRKAVDNLQAETEKNPQHKAVVYANYLNTLDDYAGELDKRKVPYAAFRGDSPPKLRQQAVKDLNEGKIKALLVSGAGGEGLDLKGVRQVQVLEPHWNDEKLRQVIGRARRYGSHDHLPPEDRKVEVERYATHMKGFLGSKRQGVEGMLYDMSDQKQRLNQQVLDLMAKQGMLKVARELSGQKVAELENTSMSRGKRYAKEVVPAAGGAALGSLAGYHAGRRAGDALGWRLLSKGVVFPQTVRYVRGGGASAGAVIGGLTGAVGGLTMGELLHRRRESGSQLSKQAVEGFTEELERQKDRLVEEAKRLPKYRSIASEHLRRGAGRVVTALDKLVE